MYAWKDLLTSLTFPVAGKIVVRGMSYKIINLFYLKEKKVYVFKIQVEHVFSQRSVKMVNKTKRLIDFVL